MNLLKIAAGVAIGTVVAGTVLYVISRKGKKTKPVTPAETQPVDTAAETTTETTTDTTETQTTLNEETYVPGQKEIFTEEQFAELGEAFYYLWENREQLSAGKIHGIHRASINEFVLSNKHNKPKLATNAYLWGVDREGQKVLLMGGESYKCVVFHDPKSDTVGWGGNEIEGVDRDGMVFLSVTTAADHYRLQVRKAA